ncbi:MAG: ABC transporter, fused permease protein [uncultured Solirubrobacteraceae bacterium]|uniref:ABC transporter, fused permease protein n=1 Tax=uncultured Solirubrobacteraceae bacterium TaxID=1162706 RepID=A0A6J4RBK1_9ACTN|nr:MAG: ABC transporter, fused permease protein [uncultured Solirubrobacteraceae bacterium]
MRRVALRGLLARKTRLLLTALSVALGVTLIAGTYVFTDTINASFDRIFSASYARTDIVVTPSEAAQLNENGDTAAIPADVRDRIAAVEGVETVEGQIFDGGGTFLGKDGEPFSLQGPKFISSPFEDERFGGVEYAQGRAPGSGTEVALDKASADREGFALGDPFRIAGEGGAKAYTIVGLTQIAGVDSFGGAAVAQLTLPEAQRVTGKDGGFDELNAAVAPGRDPAEVARAVRAAIPERTLDVNTGAQEASSQSEGIREDLGFLNTALLAFAGISLFVGAFIIFNTFSITVAQRAREFALLRTLGASRGQVLRSVLGEGLVLGLLGSLVGILLGILVATGLRELFKAVGFELPSGDSVIATRTIVVSLLVGILVTLASTLSPALRATRVPPVAALREGVALPETRGSRWALPVAIVTTALGVLLMALGLFVASGESAALSLVGGGAALTFLGVALLSPKLVGPIASVVGRPIERVAGVTGRLARENTVRQPGRTAVTAAALMVGVALVAFATIFTAGFRDTIDDSIDGGITGQAIIQSQDGFTPFAATATATLREDPRVATVSPLRFAEARVQGEESSLTGVEPASLGRVYDLDVSGLTPEGAIVSQDYAKDNGVAAGDALTVGTPRGEERRLEIVRVADIDGIVFGDVLVDNELLARDFGLDKDSFGFVGLRGAQGSDAAVSAVDDAVTRRFPQVEVLSKAQFKEEQGEQINGLLSLIYALLALSIIVSLFGIVNTLVLSITERTRELGMLRAIGTSRRQVRRMVRYESVITALIGGILGLVLGLVLAFLVTQAIDEFSVSVPVVPLVVVLLLAGVAGVLAAVLPARRASRLNVLDALAYE